MSFVRTLLLATVGLIATTTALKKCKLGTSWSIVFDEDCTRYYQCSNSVLMLKFCPRGQEFDPKSKTCRKPLFFGCRNIFKLDSQIDQLHKRPDCPYNQSETILYPHETYCTKFYSCNIGLLTILDCAAGTEFIPEKGYCDWITDGGCSSRTTNQHVICNDPNIFFVPHESDCGKYYFCLSGIPQHMQCPDGEEFDIELRKCVYISDSGCFASKTTFDQNI
ncbi:protein obstructor-E-like isoform X2 [Arctopsyche grandis]|uniref:protein obstructor-E-like isoform X2 n=1 Tax=Arctopsyche grandis TaxID=121162 RepID=UPI00406D88C6